MYVMVMDHVILPAPFNPSCFMVRKIDFISGSPVLTIPSFTVAICRSSTSHPSHHLQRMISSPSPDIKMTPTLCTQASTHQYHAVIALYFHHNTPHHRSVFPLNTKSPCQSWKEWTDFPRSQFPFPTLQTLNGRNALMATFQLWPLFEFLPIQKNSSIITHQVGDWILTKELLVLKALEIIRTTQLIGACWRCPSVKAAQECVTYFLF